MNRKAIGLLTLALAVGLGFLFGRYQPTAQGQAVFKPALWEYKIYKATDADFRANNAETDFNKLGADGWEYVQTIVSRVPQPPNAASLGANPLHGNTCVLFKRLKK